MKNTMLKINVKDLGLKRIVFVLAILATVTTGFAQNGQGRGNGGERKGPGANLDRVYTLLVDSVGIDAEQQTKVKAINKTYQTQFEELRSNAQNGGDREQMRTAGRELMKAYDGEITQVLTAEQNEKYVEMKNARREQMKKQRSQNQSSEGKRGSRGR